MIESIYIDNCGCFSEFEYKPSSLDLLLGDNGSGKSSLFNVLESLRELVVSGRSCELIFPASSRNAWADNSNQVFGIWIRSEEGLYKYTLNVVHSEKRTHSRINSEELRFNGKDLFSYKNGRARLFLENGSKGDSYVYDGGRSAISTVPEQGDYRRLTWFRNRLASVYVFSPDPTKMYAVGHSEEDRPDRFLGNYTSWLRHLLQQTPALSSEILSDLREAIDGLASFSITKEGANSRELRAIFEFREEETHSLKREVDISFDQLSDGQRKLFALYTILHSLSRGGGTLCIDEPGNYLSLREIQPWLIELQDKIKESNCQCLLISHHPEMMDYLAADHGVQFYRDGSGAARVKPFAPEADELLKPSEIVSRGWE